nr:leucine-rich repeat domain-containing protein [Salegentibacter sp. Hel_I_6]
MQNLEYLRFNNTGVTDLSPLAGYTSLTYFNANTVTGITDISPLAGNTGIKEIILREVPFGNEGMATIANFTNMYRINMRSTGVTDITVLGELMAQGALLDTTDGADEAGGADLDLRGLSIEDWSPIEPYLDQISNLEGYSEE